MDEDTNEEVNLKVLAVSCTVDLLDANGFGPGDYVVCENEMEAVCSLSETNFDLVLALIDPSSKKGINAFEDLKRVVDQHATPLASISVFNPPWIENLMNKLGVVAHFRELPTTDELVKCLSGISEADGQIGVGAIK